MMRRAKHEDRLARAMIAEGLLRPTPKRPFSGSGLLAAIAGLVLFGGGWVAGLWSGAAARPDSDYVLLLYSGSDLTPGVGSRAAEYGDWAHARHEAGRIVDGHELGRTVTTLGPPADGEPSGLFVIEASSAAEAARLARTTPHLEYGGTVVVREIPTRP